MEGDGGFTACDRPGDWRGSFDGVACDCAVANGAGKSAGLGEGGEQNAPLGRAVIGGLMFATVTTLFVVPIVYSYLRTQPPVDGERRLEQWNRIGGTR